MVLVFSSTKKCQFVVKTDGNSIFLDRETHIPNRLYIMVIYISFDEFGSKSKGDNFTKKICSR
jgi:hypothetical protein